MPKLDDEYWMRRALRLARRGWGRTAPNPLVGAVLVQGDLEVASGWHRRAGTSHAEIVAIREAGAAARGATLYVNLEPCSTSGRTPPCADAILGAGVRRVVVGSTDPNPRHRGAGLRELQSHGLEVVSGVCQDACTRLNEAFFCWITSGRPFVVLKLGMTLDGKIATARGESRWITGPAARRRVQRLRQWADAVMVGAETVRRDDPALTVRSPRTWGPQPWKFVWSRRTDFPQTLRIWADPARPPRFVQPQSGDAWRRFLAGLGAEEVTALLLEGGAELAASALRAGIVDRVDLFVAPTILGGRGSCPAVAGPDPARLDEALHLSDLRVRRVGRDMLISGTPDNVHRTD